MGRPPAETRMNGDNLEKKCGTCGQFKPLSAYQQRATRFLGTDSRCIECRDKYQEEYRNNNRVELRAKQKQYYDDTREERLKSAEKVRLKRRYNLTPEEYETLIGEGCAVCGTSEGKICIDHDHTTGEVRGVLCHNCNTVLGLVGENVDRILRLAQYLEERSPRYEVPPIGMKKEVK